MGPVLQEGRGRKGEQRGQAILTVGDRNVESGDRPSARPLHTHEREAPV